MQGPKTELLCGKCTDIKWVDQFLESFQDVKTSFSRSKRKWDTLLRGEKAKVENRTRCSLNQPFPKPCQLYHCLSSCGHMNHFYIPVKDPHCHISLALEPQNNGRFSVFGSHVCSLFNQVITKLGNTINYNKDSMVLFKNASIPLAYVFTLYQSQGCTIYYRKWQNEN